MYPLKIKSSFETGSQGEVVKLTLLNMLRSQGWQNGKPCCFHRPCNKHSDDSEDGSVTLCQSFDMHRVITHHRNLEGRATQMNKLRLSIGPKSAVSELRFVPGSV